MRYRFRRLLVTAAEDDLLERAAAEAGLSVNELVTGAALREAARVLSDEVELLAPPPRAAGDASL